MAKKDESKQSKKISGRAQRKIDEEQSKKRRLYWIVGGIAAVALIVGVAFVVRERTEEDSLPEIVLGPETNITASIDGRVAGAADTSVSVVEWGDYQ